MRSRSYRTRLSLISGLFSLLLLFGAVGCDSQDDTGVVTGTVENIDGVASITVDGVEYSIVGETDFVGYVSILDVSLGETIEIEFEERAGARVAVVVREAGFVP